MAELGIRATLKMLSAIADEGSIPSWPTTSIPHTPFRCWVSCVNDAPRGIEKSEYIGARSERQFERRGRGFFAKMSWRQNFCLEAVTDSFTSWPTSVDKMIETARSPDASLSWVGVPTETSGLS